jgi:hypothetical protein
MSDVRTDRVLLLLRQRLPELDFDDLNVTQTGFEKSSTAAPTTSRAWVPYRPTSSRSQSTPAAASTSSASEGQQREQIGRAVAFTHGPAPGRPGRCSQEEGRPR